MKKLTYLLAAAALFAACDSGNKGYNVTGTVEGATDGDIVFLKTVQGRELSKLDSAIINNGTFSFTGIQDTAAYRYITCKATGEEQDRMMGFFLENGKINIKMGKGHDVSATGTANNDIFQAIRVQEQELRQQMEAVYNSLSDSTLSDEQKQAKMEEMNTIQENAMNLAAENVKQNITNAVGIYFLKNNFYYMDVEELDPLMAQIPAEFSTDEQVVKIKGKVEKMKATAVGQKFTDFEMKTPEGETVKLSDYVGKGKVVLVDFWASWCGPCRREMPNLVDAYTKYKNKNFEIVGVSLDKSADSWKDAIKSLNITWPQMSDLKFWECEGAQLYAVNSIPHVVLIDGEGIIIARGLHGEELQEKLAEILK